MVQPDTDSAILCMSKTQVSFVFSVYYSQESALRFSLLWPNPILHQFKTFIVAGVGSTACYGPAGEHDIIDRYAKIIFPNILHYAMVPKGPTQICTRGLGGACVSRPNGAHLSQEGSTTTIITHHLSPTNIPGSPNPCPDPPTSLPQPTPITNWHQRWLGAPMTHACGVQPYAVVALFCVLAVRLPSQWTGLPLMILEFHQRMSQIGLGH